MKQYTQKLRGFTLIELLVVIGIIALLAAIVLIAINPAAQFAQATNTGLNAGVQANLNAIGQYSADNQGNLPNAAAFTTTYQDICDGTAGTCAAATINLGVLTANGAYMVALPIDTGGPTGANTFANTGYQTRKDANNRVYVKAKNPRTVRGVTPVIEAAR